MKLINKMKKTLEEVRKYPYELGINHAEDYFNNTFQVKYDGTTI
jgi:hypothetical protein